MKLLPEVPTQEMIEEGAQRLVRVETGDEVWPDAWSPADVAAARNEAERCYLSMYAAAPDVKDEHCGWCHFVEYEEYITALEFCDSDAIGAFKVYRHPSRRIAALEAEVVKLREALEEIRTFPRKRFPQDVANEALK